MTDEPNIPQQQPTETPGQAAEPSADAAESVTGPVAETEEAVVTENGTEPTSDAAVGDTPGAELESSLDPVAEAPGEEASESDSDAAEQSDAADDTETASVEPIEELDEDDEDEDVQMDWYILKVQSNRERSICDGLRRRVAIAGLDRFFGEVIVPTEDVAEYKNGKRRVVKRKLYPGYIVVQMSINDDTWFLVRETSGIGDFTGSAGRPTPMLPHEVERIVQAARPEEEGKQQIKTVIPFKQEDRVRIKEGTFENFEGNVENVDEANGRVTVIINIFGRSTPVELEHWQIESV